ncbi:NAD(P)-dependent dehydrogenase, short-chain alcohol dehydrogenase family [Erythrobacter litoralis]|jgi:NAD(P)-dependent dehydrogenase (short-subunit alcohol dehydrogenase family)|uniref:Short-chain dehydrogenase n=1 Tax=Erythrobacter litoralis TaxID=39960 RepID=A0A074MGS8_9SPHN|nr:SDR family oxidoreductase [Erythrobacter litoralis]AOL22192.1 NAD(P)-dependent dehydrogenase, short-chain alcohol dehydrogenase family [Erythrobacter litoralis]KEO91058.1 short-chain dehydrogenase [Erythrobacter litoralis]MEE4337482.1 SDR family oxidoreductase [Erythrobacter sp.]
MEKTIAITGAGQGIGRASTLHFLDKGWRVAALDIDAAALAELVGAATPKRLMTLPCDVGSEREVAIAFEAIGSWTSKAPLAALVNNAAIANPYCGPLEDVDLADWRAWLDASLTAAFLCSRAALPLLREAERQTGEAANIVNISSTRSVMSEPESFAYAASKGGIDALTHAMAVSLGPQVRVNAVRPGWIETRDWQKESERQEVEHRETDKGQHPAGRVGTPQDIAEAVEYFLGAGFVTGQHLNVDGGMTVKMIYED